MKIKALKYYLLDKMPYVSTLDNKYHQLADYITGNIQSCKITTKEIMESIESIENGVIEEDDRSGNECTAFITKENVTIENGFTGDSEIYSLKDFKYAISEWLKYLKDKKERIVEFDD